MYHQFPLKASIREHKLLRMNEVASRGILIFHELLIIIFWRIEKKFKGKDRKMRS